jgi:hypothetical protein
MVKYTVSRKRNLDMEEQSKLFVLLVSFICDGVLPDSDS